MNFTKSIIFCVSTTILLCLAGCAKKSSYKPHQLPSLKNSAHVDYQATKGMVTLRAKMFTPLDCDNFFGNQSAMKCRDPWQPIQLCIENNSLSAWELSDSNISLPLISAKKAEARFTGFHYIPAVVCGAIGLVGLGVLFLLPALLPWQTVFAAWLLGGLSSASLVVIGTPCILIIDNAFFTSCPQDIKNAIHQTEKGKAIVINTGKTIDMLIFVRKTQFKPTFDLTLLNEQDQTKKLAFTVKIENQTIAN